MDPSRIRKTRLASRPTLRICEYNWAAGACGAVEAENVFPAGCAEETAVGAAPPKIRDPGASRECGFWIWSGRAESLVAPGRCRNGGEAEVVWRVSNTTARVVRLPDIAEMAHAVEDTLAPLREGPRTVELFIGNKRGTLTPAQRADVLAFAGEWRREATGGILVDLPSGTTNDVAAFMKDNAFGSRPKSVRSFVACFTFSTSPLSVCTTRTMTGS